MKSTLSTLASLLGSLCSPFKRANNGAPSNDQPSYSQTPLTHILSNNDSTITVPTCANTSWVVPFCEAIKYLGHHDDKIFSLDIQRALNTLPKEIDTKLYAEGTTENNRITLNKDVLGKMHNLAVLMIQNDYIAENLKDVAYLFFSHFPSNLFQKPKGQTPEGLPLIKFDYIK